MIFLLLCGYPPFYADNQPSLYQKVARCRYDFDDPEWDEISENAKVKYFFFFFKKNFFFFIFFLFSHLFEKYC